MAKFLIILVLSTLFISTVTFVLVIEGSEEPQKASQTEKRPDPAAVLGPQLKGISTAVTRLSSDLGKLNSSLKLQLTQLDRRVEALDARVKALSEPVEEEPEENTGDRKFDSSEAPEKE